MPLFACWLLVACLVVAADCCWTGVIGLLLGSLLLTDCLLPDLPSFQGSKTRAQRGVVGSLGGVGDNPPPKKRRSIPPLASLPSCSLGSSPFSVGRAGLGWAVWWSVSVCSLPLLRRTHSSLMCSSRSSDVLAVVAAAVSLSAGMGADGEGTTSPITELECFKIA